MPMASKKPRLGRRAIDCIAARLGGADGIAKSIANVVAVVADPDNEKFSPTNARGYHKMLLDGMFRYDDSERTDEALTDDEQKKLLYGLVLEEIRENPDFRRAVVCECIRADHTVVKMIVDRTPIIVGEEKPKKNEEPAMWFLGNMIGGELAESDDGEEEWDEEEFEDSDDLDEEYEE